MRLTLRTMLAYLDDVLEPADARDIGQKIQNSEYATGVVHRIRSAMRRPRLGAPPVPGTKGSDDPDSLNPNTVAEYLDSTLPADQVPDFERVCLEPDNDEHLAEVAACHQILSLVLRQPAEAPAATRSRVYQIAKGGAVGADVVAPASGEAAESAAPPPGEGDTAAGETKTGEPPVAADTPDSNREKPAVPEYLREARARSWRNAAIAAAIVLLLGGGAAGLYFAGVFDPAEQTAQNDPAGDPNTPQGNNGNQPPAGPAPSDDDPAAPDGSDPATPGSGENGSSIPGGDDPAGEPAGNGAAPGDGNDNGPSGGSDPSPGVGTNPSAPGNNSRFGPEPGQAGGSNTPGGAAPMPAPGEQPGGSPPKSGGASPSAPAGGNSSQAAAPGGAPPALPNGGGANAGPDKTGGVTAGAGTTPPSPVGGPTAPGGAPAPSPATMGVARFMTDGQVLLRYDAGAGMWTRLPARAVVNAGDRLLSLPAYRPQIQLAAGSNITLVGASRLHIDAANPAKPKIDLPFGRALLVTVGPTGKDAALKLGAREGVLSLSDPDAEVALHVRRFRPVGADPVAQPGKTLIDIYAVRGGFSWTESGQAPQVVSTGQALALAEGQAPRLYPVGTLPAWLTGAHLQSIDERAARTMQPKVDEKRAASINLSELAAHRQIEVKALAIQSLTYLNQFDEAIEKLGDVDHRSYWRHYVDRLQDALDRGPEDAKQVAATLDRRRGDAGKIIYRMLWGYSPEQLRAGGAAQLVENLDHADLDVRVLAFETLRRITGRTHLYSPEDPPRRREGSIREWRTKLAAGEIVYKTAPSGFPKASGAGQPAAKRPAGSNP